VELLKVHRYRAAAGLLVLRVGDVLGRLCIGKAQRPADAANVVQRALDVVALFGWRGLGEHRRRVAGGAVEAGHADAVIGGKPVGVGGRQHPQLVRALGRQLAAAEAAPIDLSAHRFLPGYRRLAAASPAGGANGGPGAARPSIRATPQPDEDRAKAQR